MRTQRSARRQRRTQTTPPAGRIVGRGAAAPRPADPQSEESNEADPRVEASGPSDRPPYADFLDGLHARRMRGTAEP